MSSIRGYLTAIGVIGGAGLVLAACGSASTASQHASTPKPKPVVAKYGWDTTKVLEANNLPELKLPYAGVATPSIATFASQDNAFYQQVINPADWVYSPVFHQHVFVGTYTKGVAEARVIDSKIEAMVWKEELILAGARQPVSAWPGTIDGFNYHVPDLPLVLRGVTAISNVLSKHANPAHTAFSVSTPSEATIIESPVGTLTAKQMNNAAGQPQYTTIGICVPHPFEIYDANHQPVLTGGLSAPLSENFADYGNTKVLVSASKRFVNGTELIPINTCVPAYEQQPEYLLVPIVV
jgi:hypothetical protein